MITVVVRGPLTAATRTIEDSIALHHQNPNPFVRTAKANDIVQKVIRANRRLGPNKENTARHTFAIRGPGQ
jgi:hypothetical protein